MLVRRTLESYRVRGLLALLARNRSSITGTSSLCNSHGTPVASNRYNYSMNQGLQLITADSRFSFASGAKMDKGNSSGLPPKPGPQSSKPKFPSWIRWILGAVLSLFLPLWNLKFDRLIKWKDEVEIVAEEVEFIADIVEKAATATENIAAEVADEFLHDGKLKEAALMVERISEEAAKDAHQVKDFLHKVKEVEEEVETLIQPAPQQEPKVDKSGGAVVAFGPSALFACI